MQTEGYWTVADCAQAEGHDVVDPQIAKKGSRRDDVESFIHWLEGRKQRHYAVRKNEGPLAATISTLVGISSL